MRRGGTLIVAVVAMLALLPAWAHAANPIQDENTLQGDAGWDVTTLSPGILEGYADRISAAPGDTVNLKVSSTTGSDYRVEVYRLGWYGGLGGRLMTCLPSCSGSKAASSQPYPTPDPTTGLVRANWATTDSFTVGSDWVSGYYIALLKKLSGAETGSGFVVPFIVRAPAARAKVMLLQASTNTWQAYNKWGGKSLYNSNSDGGVHADKVSFDRPFHRDTQGPYRWDLQLVRFLEREGYDVAYQADADTHQDPLGLRSYRLVATAGHDEYWSKEMRDAFEGARDVGVNLAFFGANTSYWQNRFEDDTRTIVGYKDRSRDPEPDQTLKTIQPRVLIPARPECALLGVQYQGGALSNDAYRAYTPDTGSLGDPWFGQTGFTAGATVPEIVGYEWDSMVPGCPVPGTPTPLMRYEGGTTVETAHATRYTAPSGAKVFATGTLNWSWKLDSFVQHGDSATGHGEDARVQQLTINMLNDLTSPSGTNTAPTASFTRDLAAPVAGQSVTFTDTSTDGDGTIATRAWDLNNDGVFDDGTGSTASRTFTTPGTYTLGLRVTDNAGASTSTTMTFVVGSGNASPVATFTRDVSAPVAGQGVTFTDTSTDSDGTVAARAWDLDNDGNYNDGTGATAAKTFVLAGSYTIRLRVTDDQGATATTSMTFTVAAAPGQFANVQHKGAFSSGTATSLTVTPASALQAGNLVVVSVGWADQTSTPAVSDGLGNVYTAIGTPARYAGSRSVQLFYAKNVNPGASPITVTFSAAVASRWIGMSEYSGIDTAAPLVASNVGNGGNALTATTSVAATAAGQLIFAVNQNGGGGIASVTGTSPTLLDTGSGGNVGQAQDGSAAAGATGITFRFNQNGAWATAAAAFKVKANAAPLAAFTRDVLLPQAGQAITFTDTSTDGDGAIAARAWDLDGDGFYNDGTGATATRTFATAGTYTVGLRVTDNQGATATQSMTVSVAPIPNAPPVASFARNVASPVTGDLVTFTDTSTDADGTIAARAWDFDDDGQYDDATDDGANANASWVFVTAGTHTVRERVTDNSGATAIAAMTVTVAQGNVAPVAAITRVPRVPRAGDAMTFTDASTDADGTIASRAWDLNDDGQYDDGTGATATTTFAAAGIYTIHLRVTDAQGATDTATMTFAVYSNGNIPPTVDFTRDIASPRVGETVTFTDVSTDLDGSIATREWDLDDDGNFDNGTGTTASASFSSPGDVTVRLRVTDDGGTHIIATTTFTVRPPNAAPTVDFTRDVAAPVAGDLVTFTDTSTDSDGTIAARAWDLDDDGNFDNGTGTTAGRSFGTPGTYTVRLRVTDDDGASVIATMSLTVLEPNTPPAASFARDVTAPLTGEAVTFTDTSTDADGTIAARAWDLDDDGQYDDGTGATATTTFAAAGSRTVRLRVTDDRGGAATSVMTVVVTAPNEVPSASFTRDPAAPLTGEAVTFTDTSTDADGTIVARAWDLDDDGDFDDGTGTTAATSFATPGSYTVRLRVTDDAGAHIIDTMSFDVASAPPWTNLQHRGSFSSALATTLDLAPASALTAGSLVVVAVEWGGQSTTASVTDTLGNAYTAIGSPSLYAGSRAIQLFYARNVTGGATTVTATFSAPAGNRFVGVAEYRGLDPLSPLIASANARGGNAAAGAATVGATAGGQLVVAAEVNGAGGITSVTGNAPTLLDTGAAGNVGQAMQLAPGAGPTAITFNHAQSGSWAATTAVFAPTVSPAG